MAPLLFGYGQDLINQIHKEAMVKEYIAKHGIPGSASSTPSSPVVIADDADLSVHTETEYESVHEETTIDQSVHGVSFINMHWASISTGISSILAVVVLIFIVAGCCYFRGRRQRQSRARHAEVHHNIVSSSGHHTSTPVKVQSGAYPGPSSSEVIRADPFIFDTPARASIFDSPIGGPTATPAIQFSAAAASCGLPGCSTKYQHKHPHPIASAPLLSVAYDARHSRTIEFLESRSTGIHSLSR